VKIGFGLFGALLIIVGYVPYIRSILRHVVKPQRISWGIWTILTVILFVNQVKNGGGYSSVFMGCTAVLVATTFLLSMKLGIGGASTADRILLVSAMLLLGYWLTVQDTRLSTIVAVSVDFLGAIPTVIKARRQPHTENYAQWILAGLGGLFSMLAVARHDYILYIYPIYNVTMNGVIVCTKYYAQREINKLAE
jgi:hypothetical protein